MIHHAYKLTYENLTPQRLIELLGEPGDIREYFNEAYGICETVYRFEAGEFLFELSPEGEPYIKSAKLTTPILETRRGITVGSTREEVGKAYGNFFYRSDEMWTTSDPEGLIFVFQGDVVREIIYVFLKE